MKSNNKRGKRGMKKIILVLLFVIFIFLIGCTTNNQIEPQSDAPPPELPEEQNRAETSLPPDQKQIPTEEAIIPETEPAPNVPQWKERGTAIAGKYADADVVALGDGRYRMYYSAEPEVPHFKGQVYSALSSDGTQWTTEAGTRKEGAIFPSVIKLPDGKYRMYFQNQGLIKSALSSDGLTWKDEAGTRIDLANSAGIVFETVVAPTVISAGREYVMVYGGAINEEYSAEKVPNRETHILMWATSTDGLNFEKKGVAVDSRNSMFKGWLDGPEFVSWDGETRLYFWSYRGIYHVVFNASADTPFSAAEFDFTNAEDSTRPFPPDPPGDPTLAKIGGQWLMYYGQHEQGIYYAQLE